MSSGGSRPEFRVKTLSLHKDENKTPVITWTASFLYFEMQRYWDEG